MNTNSSNFFLMRHGETDTNRNNIWQGSQDIPLNETGREQARKASIIVSEFKPDFVITSTLSRAIETGEIAARNVANARFIVDPEIRERECGEVEGLTTAEIQERYHLSMTMTSRQLDAIPGAEPLDRFVARIKDAMDRIYDEYSGKKVLVVSHGGVIRAFYQQNLGLLPSGMVFGNCAILSLQKLNRKWSLVDKYNTFKI